MTAGLTLVAAARGITELVMKHAMPHRQLYKRAKYQRTADFSDMKAEHGKDGIHHISDDQLFHQWSMRAPLPKTAPSDGGGDDTAGDQGAPKELGSRAPTGVELPAASWQDGDSKLSPPAPGNKAPGPRQVMDSSMLGGV